MKRLSILFVVVIFLLPALFGCGEQNDVSTDTNVSTDVNTSTDMDASTDTDASADAAASTDTEASSGEIRILDLGYVSYEEYIDGDIAVNVSYQVPFLSEADEDQYPALQAAFDQLKNDLDSSVEEQKNSLASYIPDLVAQGGTADSYMSLSDERESTILRADTNAVSMYVYHYGYTGGAHGYYDYSGYNYDTETGRHLNLTDVVTDTEQFFDLVSGKLQAEYEDIADEFTSLDETIRDLKENPDIPWSMTSEGVTVYFNTEVLASYAAGAQVITVYFQEAPEIFAGKYKEVPDSYIIPLTQGENYQFDVNDASNELKINDILNTDEYDNAYYNYEITMGEKNILLQAYASAWKGYVLRYNGKYYLYFAYKNEGDAWYINFIDLQTMTYDENNTRWGTLEKNIYSSEIEEDCYRYKTVTYPTIDPSNVYIAEGMSVFGTYDGYKTYIPDEQGNPQPKQEQYTVDADYVLRTKTAVTAEVADDSGNTVETVEIPENTYLLITGTDNERYAQFQIISEENVTKTGEEPYIYYNRIKPEESSESKENKTYRITRDDTEWPITINGVAEEDIFEGLLYAG